MAGLIFNYYQEKVQNDGTITYILKKELPEIKAVNVCKVDIEFNKFVVQATEPPEIFPLGVQGKTASISGSFGSPIDSILTLPSILDDYAIQPGYVLSVKTDPNNTAWLLHDGLWKIENFAFDREGLKQGKIGFNASLIYIWEDNESMYKYFGEGNPVNP